MYYIRIIGRQQNVLLPCGKHLYDCNIALRREVWEDTTRLIPPHICIEVPESSCQESERSCICVR
jgi:hypothetical protein